MKRGIECLRKAKLQRKSSNTCYHLVRMLARRPLPLVFASIRRGISLVPHILIVFVRIRKERISVPTSSFPKFSYAYENFRASNCEGKRNCSERAKMTVAFGCSQVQEDIRKEDLSSPTAFGSPPPYRTCSYSSDFFLLFLIFEYLRR